MAGSLTDAQLRISLKELGYDAGPITESTRSVYEKKLMKLMDQPKASSTASQKKRKGKTQQNEIPDSISKRSEPQELDAKGMNVVPDRVASSSENSRSGSSSYIARRASIGRSGDATLTNDWSPATSSMITPSVLADSKNRLAHSVVSRTLSRPEEHISTKLTATTESCFSRVNTPQRAAGHTPTRKTYIYYSNGGNGQSESDTDEEPPSRTSLSGTISRVAGWLRKEAQPNDSGLSVSSRRTGRYSFDRELHEDGQIQVSDTDHSDIESRHRSPFFSGLRNPPNSVLARDAGTVTSKSLLFTPPRSASRVLASPKRFGQSFLSDDSDDHGFHDDRSDPSVGVILRNNRISRTWTRYLSSSVSHIPNLILVCSIVLLFVLVMSYLILKDHHGEVGKMADLQKLICPSSLPAGAIDPIASHKCLPQSDINEALPVLSTTFDVLSRYAGEYHCKQNQLLSPRLSIISAAGLVKLNTESAGTVRKEFPVVWKHVLYLILHFGKAHFSIACYDASGREIGPNSDPIEVSELESLQPYFSGTCRLKRLVSWLIRLCVTILGVLVALGSFIGVVLLLRWVRTNRIQAAEKRLARIRDLVADIVRKCTTEYRISDSSIFLLNNAVASIKLRPNR
ncbi:putative peptide chain release factor [Fasciola hepatica]|uniref:Peptide chain release factor n=1 Tax=Fasciola hepatica TaxID=6192 RepID=A0A2H1BTS3_FASHE|nr:putative peptide chain release factor [Fasciola hepatica]